MVPDPVSTPDQPTAPAEPAKPAKPSIDWQERALAAEAKVSAAATKAAEARQKSAEESGRFKDLYTEVKSKHEAASTELAALRKVESKRIAELEASNTERIASLNEQIRPLVPAGLPPDALSSWLAKASATTLTAAMPAGTRAGGAKRDAPPPAAIAEARKMGYQVDNPERMDAFMTRVWPVLSKRPGNA